MTQDEGRPRAQLAVMVNGVAVRVGPLTSSAATGTVDLLDLLDRVLRLDLALRRLGWALQLTDVCPELFELVELAGLSDVLGVTA